VSTIDEFDCDELIFRLTGPLSPPDRIAFRRAAEEALARAPCWSEGAVYWAVAAVQRTFFDPSGRSL
jgi:monoamine oxidase